MGIIRKTKNNKYQADVVNTYGKRLRKVFDRKADAQAYISITENEKYNNRLVNAGLKRPKTSLAEAINKAVDEKAELAESSYKKYKNVYHQFELFCVNEQLTFVDEFNKSHADKFSDKLTSSKAAAKTVNFYLMTIKALFNDLVIADYILKNPFEHIKNMKVKSKSLAEKEDEYYSDEEIKNFFSQAIPPKYRLALLGLFLTGMRFEELSSLKWTNINWEDRLIAIRNSDDFTAKTFSSERDLPISNFLIKVLLEEKENSKSEFVFSSIKENKLSERTLLSQCKKIAMGCGIVKNATLHMFRHSFNSHLAQRGIDYSIRQFLMGHKPQTMTEHYTKFNARQLHDTVNLLDELVVNCENKNDKKLT